MKKIILFFIVFLMITGSSCNLRAEEVLLNIDEAVGLALRQNRDILLKAEDVKIAQSKISEAQAGFFPTLDFTASRVSTMDYYAKSIPETKTQTTLKQYIYKGGKTVASVSRDKYSLKAQEALLDKTKLETVLNVKKAFYTLLLALDYVRLNAAILTNSTEHLIMLKKRYDKGETPRQDILNVQSSLANAKEAYRASLNQVASGQELLNNILYLDKDAKIIPEGEFIYDEKEFAFDKAFLKAIQDRPEIKQYTAQEQADKKSIEVAKASARPSVYASWDYYSRSNASLTFTPGKGWQDYSVVGITFSWPVFDGWATKAKVDQAIADLKQTQLFKDKTVKDIALELKQAYLDLKGSFVKIDASKAEVDLYRDTFQTAKDKYKVGMLSSLDLDDISLGYRVSIFNYKQALYDYTIASESFVKATGGIQ